jgi:RHS repeat-associated protein
VPIRGNATTVTHWAAPTTSCNPKSGTAVSSHTNWYDTGEPFQKVDPLGHTTTISYDPAYAAAYPTQTCSPSTGGITHCVKGAYDLNTGVLTSLTDQNGQTSNFAYDYMFHIASAQGPPDAANGNLRANTSFSYSTITTPGVFPVTITRQKSITTALTDSATNAFDGLARPIVSQHAMPSGPPSTVNTSYDDLSARVSVTNPFYSTADSTYGTTITQSDALGRALTVTEQDGSVKSISYDVAAPAGTLGNCNLTTDEAGNQRRSCSDALGRLVEVDEPGPPFAGTPASGSVNFGGVLKSVSGIGAHAGVQASSVLTLNGLDHIITVIPKCPPRQTCDQTPVTTLDSGVVTITVNGRAYSYVFGQGASGDTAFTVASGLANSIHLSDPQVDGLATNTGSTSATITLTARTAGAGGNSIAFNTSWTWDTVNFPTQGASFSFAAPTSGTLANGIDAFGGNTVWDTGTVSLAVGAYSAQICYGVSGQCAAIPPASGCVAGNSDATQVACLLAYGIRSLSPPFTISASGGLIAINWGSNTAAGNVAVTASSSTTQTAYFSTPSFAGCSGSCGAATANPQSFATATTGGQNPTPPSVNANYFATLYQYDALGNLLCVEQHGNATGTGCSAPPSSDATSPWRVRRFTYDSLSRLLTAHNPESGTITYAYDVDGNLLQKTSPAPNQTGAATQTISYCYDELHRVTGKAYSAQSCPLASPVVTYSYDSGANAIGKLTSLTDQAGSASYAYDNLGRMISETRVIAGVSKSVSFEYNLDGSLSKLHYPSGRVVTYTPDSAGRITAAADGNGTQYVTSATYYANGAEYQRSYPGVYFATGLNQRLQVAFFYSNNGQPGPAFINKSYVYGALHQNNGNITSIVANEDASRTQTFTYDALNRITSGYSAAATGPYSWGETYSVDPWGNLNIAPMGGKAHGGTFANASNNNNQPLGFTYDAAGNLTNTTQYVYDPENRIQTTAGTVYTYDADGQRVLKSNTSGTALKRYWMGNGNVLAEADGSGNLTAEYIYFNGKRIARIDLPANTVHYYLSDHLGSTTKIISAAGVVEEESDFTAFGSELSATSGANHYKFTSKERDTETGLDYFGARYYSNLMGRFMTPDWAAKATAVPYAVLGDPQSLNLYMYVLNNPLSNRDDDGHATDTSKQKAAKNVDNARTSNGTDRYDIKNTVVSNGQVFKSGSDKCNLYVSETVKNSTGEHTTVDGTGKIPSAAQFADPNVKITGLSAPEPMANAKPGDVIAQDHGANPKSGNEEGHVGIVVSLPHDGQPGQTASANANQGGKVTINDWGFRSPTANPNNGERHGADSPAPVVRHPL